MISFNYYFFSQTVNGQAIDRHLLGMKLAAIESGMKLHELFIDSSYQYALHYKLSTSQVMITYITAYSSLNFRTVSLVCVVCIISCSTLVLQQKTSGLALNHHDGGSWARISSRNLFFRHVAGAVSALNTELRAMV